MKPAQWHHAPKSPFSVYGQQLEHGDAIEEADVLLSSEGWAPTTYAGLNLNGALVATVYVRPLPPPPAAPAFTVAEANAVDHAIEDSYGDDTWTVEQRATLIALKRKLQKVAR